MVHRETKKETKMQNQKHSKPEVRSNDDLKTRPPKGVIKGTE
jgi:hypothetical protein